MPFFFLIVLNQDKGLFVKMSCYYVQYLTCIFHLSIYNSSPESGLNIIYLIFVSLFKFIFFL